MNFFLPFLFPSLVWRIPTNEKKIYLTFDDGPIQEVTPWVIDTLKEYNASATFFCVGENAKRNPGLIKRLNESGHVIGNHTMHHLNGWENSNENYFSDVEECRQYVPSKLFRPPYGKIKLSQVRFLKKDFRLIMWDVLSKDYDQSLTGQQCFERVRQKTRSGSIIVFHDSLKAEERLRVALPMTLKYFTEKGYQFHNISI